MSIIHTKLTHKPEDKLLFAYDIYYRYFRFEFDTYRQFKQNVWHRMRYVEGHWGNIEFVSYMDIGIQDLFITEESLKNHFRWKHHKTTKILESIELIAYVEDWLKERKVKKAVNITAYVFGITPQKVYNPDFGYTIAVRACHLYKTRWNKIKEKYEN